MSEFVLFTVCHVFKDYVKRTDFDQLPDAKDFYYRHRYDAGLKRSELIGFSVLVGVVTIWADPGLTNPDSEV